MRAYVLSLHVYPIRMTLRTLSLLLFAALLFACGNNKELVAPAMTDVIMLDTAEVAPPPKRNLRPTEKKVHDLLHTKLQVSFDWQQRHLNGTAELTLKPYFYPSNRLMLDAKGMDIHRVVLVDSVETTLTYSYDSLFLDITLPRKYSRFEEYTVLIDYTAKPDELRVQGSDAITDAKGLYFINPDSTEANKPTQVWTQGQTEASSCWFPTIDTPAERMTQELFITVTKDFQTLSNGTLVYSNFNDDDTRTDYWKLDEAHPPYLTMLAAGDFLIANDEYINFDGERIPVTYYLEREYAPYAWKIFGSTPEMMQFYSKLLDYDFPWDKYAQIVVRDYVSGAMENTTAVIHGDFLHQTDRELLDYDNEEIIAHELFHHWFGDLVTCESWSHLPLNESFATYGEYLWEEYKYGKDAADFHGFEDEEGYMNEARYKKVPLIRFDYDDKEDMFDAHSYNKGGRILHMLRNVVGDTAFFTSLNHYLKKNAFKDAETDKLRLAFEEVTGVDLNWFFDQWFYGAGHPVLDISYFYDDSLKQQQVVISQLQEAPSEQVYTLPMAIELHFGDRVQREEVLMTEREQLFRFDVDAQPDWVNVDADKVLLCEKSDNKPADWWAQQFAQAGNFRDRLESMQFIAENGSAAFYPTVEQALNDPFWYIRSLAVMQLDTYDSLSTAARTRLTEMAYSDPDTDVRYDALVLLGAKAPDALDVAKVEKGITNERSYWINAGSLIALAHLDIDKALRYAQTMQNDLRSGRVIDAIATVYAMTGDPKHHDFFRTMATQGDGEQRYIVMQAYAAYLEGLELSDWEPALDVVREVSTNRDPWWIQIPNYRLLNQLILRFREASTAETNHPLLSEAEALRDQLLANESISYLKRLLQSE